MTALGLNIPNFGPGTDPRVLRGWTSFAVDGGFQLAMVSDHVAPTPDVAALYPAPFYDPFATLAWMAGHADGLELGTTVTILPYRHPLLTASMAAAITDFTGGRFVLGVGAGWAEQEFEALGVPFAERGRITDEYLAAITGAWRSPSASLDGAYVSYRDVATGPRTAPRVWVGGAAAPAIRRAARFGDAWHPNNAPIGWLRDTGLPALRARSGRTAFCPRMRARITGRDLPEDDRRPGEGSLAQVVRDVRELIAMGAEYVVLDTNPDHPRDRRPAAEDWRDLAAIADRLRGP
jgi:alkanesulfonate monooxygenase SsuD/methylene tetrahydromethanopterin reductase-like flavin-dependent oxidoreductase (luciferase family)